MGEKQQHPGAGRARVRGRDRGPVPVVINALHSGGQRRLRVRHREAERRVPGPPSLAAAGLRGEAGRVRAGGRSNVRRGGGVHPRRGHAPGAVAAGAVRAGQVVRAVREGGGREHSGGHGWWKATGSRGASHGRHAEDTARKAGGS